MQYWWDCKKLLLLWKTACQFFKISNLELPYDPTILSQFLPRRNYNMCLNKNVYINVHINIGNNSWKVGTTQKYPLTDKWINVIHTHNGISFNSLKCQGIDPCYNMNLENIKFSERSESQKAICCMIPFICNVQSKWIHRDRKEINGFLGAE